MSELEETFGWLLRIFSRRREDGTHYYDNATLLEFIPVMLLSFGFDAEALPPEVRLVVGEFAAKAGVRAGMSRDETAAAIQAYLARHPLDPELAFEFKRGLREERVSRGNEELAEAFASLVASRERSFERLLDGETPVGAVKGGPFAQFTLAGPAPKKKTRKRR